MVYNWLPFPHAFHGLHVSLRFSRATCFLHFSLSYTCFPTLASSYMFSQTIHWLHVFPRSPLSTCFPTLVTGYKFSRASQWLHVSPRSCSHALAIGYSFKFLSFVNDCMFSRACHWLHIFPPLPMVSFFSLFLWTEYDVFSHYSRVTRFFALTALVIFF